MPARVEPDRWLAGRRVLVTGASRGIGRGVALAAARAGADVVTCHRQDSPHVASLKRELAKTPGDHLVSKTDVTSATAVDALLTACAERYGRLDGVVNNAGSFAPLPYGQLDSAAWAAAMDGNVTATHLVTRRALPLLSDGASIVNLGSTVTFIGMDQGVHYTTAKAAIVGMTRSLSRELGPRGIRVNTLSPGRIETEAMDELPSEVAARQREMFSSFAALGRLGSVEDVAHAVLFLLSEHASYVTGQDIHIDGCV